MSRKDIAADLDRPHFYSQFWIDVAGGKRDVTLASDSSAEIEPEDADEAEFEPVAKVAPVAPAKKSAKTPEKKQEAPRPTITSLADLANIDLLMKSSAEMDTEEVPDFATGPASDLEPIATDFSADALEAEPELAADEGEELDFDEDEEDEEWGGARRGPRQSKPRRRERPERPERGRGF